ncbi:MAG: NigD-like N-terminal domain-containing protein [Bacteroidetes bacterium]|nr:NigD-like N-terminal domain-containing protein [Bacteroidota bacterium]
MKQIIIILFLFSIALVSCQQEEEITFYETGVVVDYAGAGNCSFIIELDNGSRIQPLYYPKGFTFTHGQRVLVEYVELPNVIAGCDRGTATEIKYAEELSCAPFVDLYFENYDSLARDPIFLHEAFVDGDCLYIKLSYSGGCKEHIIDLARMHPWTASSSTVPTFEIRHNANNDLCEAYFTKELRFNLTALKLEGKSELVLTAKLTNGEVYNKIFDLNFDE